MSDSEEMRPDGFKVVSKLADQSGCRINCSRHRTGLQVNFFRGRWLVASWWTSTGSLTIGPRKLLAQSLEDAWKQVEQLTAAN